MTIRPARRNPIAGVSTWYVKRDGKPEHAIHVFNKDGRVGMRCNCPEFSETSEHRVTRTQVPAQEIKVDGN